MVFKRSLPSFLVFSTQYIYSISILFFLLLFFFFFFPWISDPTKPEMGGSMGVGFIAVFAVSGSVVLLVHQAHKRLLSDFMKKVESELGTGTSTTFYAHAKNKLMKGSGKCQAKKKVRFADDVKEPSSNNKEYRQRQVLKHAMPANRQAL